MYSISVITAENVQSLRKKGKADTYVKVYVPLGGSPICIAKTAKSKSKNPEWDLECKKPFSVPFHAPSKFIFELWDHEVLSANSHIAGGTIEFCNVKIGEIMKIPLTPVVETQQTETILLSFRIDSQLTYLSPGQPTPNHTLYHMFLAYNPPLQDPSKISFSLQIRDPKDSPIIFPPPADFPEKNKRPISGLEQFTPSPTTKLIPTGWTPLITITAQKFEYNEFYPVVTSNGYMGNVMIKYVAAYPEPQPDPKKHKLDPASYPPPPVVFYTDTLKFLDEVGTSYSLLGSTFINVKNRPCELNRLPLRFTCCYPLERLERYHGRTLSDTIFVSVSRGGLCDSSSRSFQITCFAINESRVDVMGSVCLDSQVSFDGAIEYQQANEFRSNRILIDIKSLPVTIQYLVMYVSVWPKTPLRRTQGCSLKIENEDNYELLYINLDTLPPQEGETGLEEGIIGTILYKDEKLGWTFMPPTLMLHGKFQVTMADIKEKIMNFVQETDFFKKNIQNVAVELQPQRRYNVTGKPSVNEDDDQN